MRKFLLLICMILIPCKLQAVVPVLTQICTGHQDDTGTGSATCSLTLGASRTVFLSYLVFSGTAIRGDSPLALSYSDTFAVISHNFGGFPTILQTVCASTGAGGFTTFFAQNGTVNGGEALVVLEYSGLNCTTNGNNGNFGTTVGSNVTVSSGTAVTTQADFLISAGFTFNQSPTAGIGYTIVGTATFNNSASGGGNNTLTVETNPFSPAGTRDGEFVIPSAGVWECGFGSYGPVTQPTNTKHKAQVIRYRSRSQSKVDGRAHNGNGNKYAQRHKEHNSYPFHKLILASYGGKFTKLPQQENSKTNQGQVVNRYPVRRELHAEDGTAKLRTK